MYLDITASRGQELFKVPISQTRLYFPEEYGVVLHAEEYAKQRQEANALQFEVEKAKKFGLSLEEYRSQKEYLEKASKDKKIHHPQQTGGSQEMEESAAGVGVFKNDESEMAQLSESMMHIQAGEPLSEERRQQEERAFQLARQQSQHGGSDRAGYEVINGGEVKPIESNYLDVQPYHTAPEDHQQDVSPVSQGLQRPSPKPYHEEEGYTSLPSPDGRYYQRHSPDPNPCSPDPPAGRLDHRHPHESHHHYPPGDSSDYHDGSADRYHGGSYLDYHYHSPCGSVDWYSSGSSNQYPPGGPPDPHHQFTIGSMVCIDTQRGDPLYGVVQWIGTLPDFKEGIAGLEMVITIIIMC